MAAAICLPHKRTPFTLSGFIHPRTLPFLAPAPTLLSPCPHPPVLPLPPHRALLLLQPQLLGGGARKLADLKCEWDDRGEYSDRVWRAQTRLLALCVGWLNGLGARLQAYRCDASPPSQAPPLVVWGGGGAPLLPPDLVAPSHPSHPSPNSAPPMPSGPVGILRQSVAGAVRSHRPGH